MKLVENIETNKSETKYFESRLQPILRKMLISVAVMIINDLVVKIT